MIKYGHNHLIKPLHKLFDLIYTGNCPKQWSQGRIISIHKNGDTSVESNCRGITISSVLGELFNSILNNRLSDYLQQHNMLCAEQAGFRKDQVCPQNIMSKYKHENKVLYVAFIDFKQAFDSIRHQDPLYKLLSNKVNISTKF